VEVDTSGSVVRRYRSSLSENSFVDVAHSYDRIIITEPLGGTELLDSEFNLLGTCCLPQDANVTLGLSNWLIHLHYNRERNEIARFLHAVGTQSGMLTTFRLVEE